jgi:hypothetical protein
MNKLSKKGEWVAMGDLVTDDMLETFAIVAAPGDVAAGIADRWGGTVDRIAFDAPYEHDTTLWPSVIADLKRRA